MLVSPIEIEGTWEQITAQAARFSGHRMRLTILPEAAGQASAGSDTRTLEEKMAEIAGRVPEAEWENLPADMGENLDHYLYGTPKRG